MIPGTGPVRSRALSASPTGWRRCSRIGSSRFSRSGRAGRSPRRPGATRTAATPGRRSPACAPRGSVARRLGAARRCGAALVGRSPHRLSRAPPGRGAQARGAADLPLRAPALLGRPARAGGRASAPATARKIPEVERWFYLPLWKQTAPLPPASASSGAGRWLIFEDGYGVGRALGARLRAEGHAVTPVSAGASFSRRDDGGYVIDPTRAGDYSALFAALAAPPDGIAHLFGVTRDEERSFEQIQREGSTARSR